MGDPRSLRDVREGAVAPVAVEGVRAAGESERSAGHRDVVVEAVGGLSRPRRGCGVEVQVAGDEQVEVAVTVVVQEAAAGSPPLRRAGDTRLLRDVRERPVAVVVVEDVLSPVGDEQVVVAVVVVVADAAALPPAGVGEARLLGDVGERAVAVVVEQVAPRRGGRARPGRSSCRSRGRCRASRRGRSRRTRPLLPSPPG